MKLTLKEIKDYFKREYNWTDSISIGKIDNNQEKAICFYNSARESVYAPHINGKMGRSTYIKPISILLKYTKNQDSAERKIQSIYEFFEERTFFIDGKKIFIIMTTDDPISLGTDENNVYEYSLEIDLYVER